MLNGLMLWALEISGTVRAIAGGLIGLIVCALIAWGAPLIWLKANPQPKSGQPPSVTPVVDNPPQPRRPTIRIENSEFSNGGTAILIGKGHDPDIILDRSRMKNVKTGIEYK